uniref:Mediator of RNA polymerase II transcription subunit 32-like n=1 Tax=Tanacetum cinerariifolium TaxID=118510 RepID=A0A699I3I5_TANCI|nr:mediator of RNA polymerase II transcription subunit 32-like [Tanacetum cinerariifolium]
MHARCGPNSESQKKHSVVRNDIVETDVASHHIKTVNRHIADALGPVETSALGNLKQRWEISRFTYDQAHEFLKSVKFRIGSKCLVNEAKRTVARNQGKP